MLAFQQPEGIGFAPLHRVASLRPDYGDRIQVVLADGTVGHRPGPMPTEGPWVKVDDALVQPDHIENGHDPAGFPYPVSPGSPIPPPDEHHAVLYLQGADNHAVWHTDDGPRPAGSSAEKAAAQHPHLVRAGRGTYVNRRRLRLLVPERKRFRLILDEGTQLTVSWGARQPLQKGLGLADLYTLEPIPAIQREQLRDWPLELARAREPFLRLFHDARQLIANLLWQTVRYRQLGQNPDYGHDHRSYWYVPLAATLARAGLRPHALWDPPDDLKLLGSSASDRLYALFLEVVGTLVGEDALFTFHDLGFRDPRPDLRRIGKALPGVILVAEKASLEEAVALIGDRHGVSTLILGGVPALLSTEFFVTALREVHPGPVELISLVDFDPGGWQAAGGFASQLSRYGVETLRLRHLVRPERFTAEEIELYAMPIEQPTPQVAGKVKAWLEESGGIQGQALRLHADHLRPPERVLAAFESMLTT